MIKRVRDLKNRPILKLFMIYLQRLRRRYLATCIRRRAHRWHIVFELPSLQRCRDGRTHDTYTPWWHDAGILRDWKLKYLICSYNTTVINQYLIPDVSCTSISHKLLLFSLYPPLVLIPIQLRYRESFFEM